MLTQPLLVGLFVVLSAAVGCDFNQIKAAITSGSNKTVAITCGSVVLVDSPLVVSTSMTIQGYPGLVLDGRGKFRVFTVAEGVKVTIRDMTIQNGKGTDGGCIYGASTTEMTLQNVHIRQCKAENGGGIYSSGSSKNTFINSQITECEASGDGGGALISKKSITTITNCVFSANKAQRGGAIRKNPEDFDYWRRVGLLFTIRDSQFLSNIATTSSDRAGGAISFHSGQYLVERTLFQFNIATVKDAGAFYSLHADGYWRDSVFIGNKAPNGIGGAMRVDGTGGRYKSKNSDSEGGSIIFERTSFFENSASNVGAIWLCLYEPGEGNDRSVFYNSSWCGNEVSTSSGKCAGPGFYCGGPSEIRSNRFGSDHVPRDSQVLKKSSRSFCDTHDVTTITNTRIPGRDGVPFSEDDSICAPWKDAAMALLS